MDLALESSNLKTLKEMILDERKLVTYISLSKELCVHVNEGKSLLCQVVENIRKNCPATKLFVSYIISGLLDNNKASTTVCPEAGMESLKKTFTTTFYQHIYSVSHGLATVDNVAFAALNNFEDFPLCIGLIKGNTCIKRSQEDIGNLKSNSQSVINESKSITINKQNKDQAKEVIKKGQAKEVVKNGHENVKTVHETKSEPVPKTEIPSPKKNNSTGQISIKKNGKAATNSIAGFFNKTPSQKLVTKSIIKSPQENGTETKEKDVKIEIIKTEESTTKEKQKDPPTSKPKSKGKGANSSLTQFKKNAKVDKKRKRVLHVSDSESEDEVNDPFREEMAVDHESEDEIPPTPTVNTVKITSGIVNPKKRRKIVDKTYTDEEGYILTKKEEVYESCSENEDEENCKQNIEPLRDNNEKIKESIEVSPKSKGKNSKKKVSPPQKGKQSSIMNFFSKKV